MKVIVISGPTASGKTDLAIDLAERFNGEVVNFDSLLLYNEINIGTAKPTSEEIKSIHHHMINVRSISSAMNAADYAREAFPIVNNILSNKKLVFLVGGSGFYLQALLKGMYDSPTTPIEITKRSDELYAKEGILGFVEILKKNDPKSFERYHINDHYRIRRAVEHFWTTGFPLSEAREDKDKSNSILKSPTIHPWEILHIFLDIPKDMHLKIIEKRSEKMIQNGLVEEVSELLKMGFTGNEKPLQSIGYKETLDYLQGKFKSLDDYKVQIIISTRQLAKSQRTWFKRDQFKMTFNPLEEREKILREINQFIQNK